MTVRERRPCSSARPEPLDRRGSNVPRPASAQPTSTTRDLGFAFVQRAHHRSRGHGDPTPSVPRPVAEALTGPRGRRRPLSPLHLERGVSARCSTTAPARTPGSMSSPRSRRRCLAERAFALSSRTLPAWTPNSSTTSDPATLRSHRGLGDHEHTKHNRPTSQGAWSQSPSTLDSTSDLPRLLRCPGDLASP
jgi:hypothetical protein